MRSAVLVLSSIMLLSCGKTDMDGDSEGTSPKQKTLVADLAEKIEQNPFDVAEPIERLWQLANSGNREAQEYLFRHYVPRMQPNFGIDDPFGLADGIPAISLPPDGFHVMPYEYPEDRDLQKQLYKWIDASANTEDFEAQFALARIYALGLGTDANKQKAGAAFDRAVRLVLLKAESEDQNAQYDMGLLNESQLLPSDGSAAAAIWYERAAGHGHQMAKLRLARLFALGEGVTKDVERAIAWLEQFGDGGNGWDRERVARIFESGDLVAKDADLARRWYAKAAEEYKVSVEADGSSHAHWRLAYLYANGRGVERDPVLAKTHFEKALQPGDAEGRVHLGWSYYQGESVPKSEEVAFEWFLSAAVLENLEAQFLVGVLYSKGEGVVQDATEAFKWYTKAAEGGHADAQRELGRRYGYGIGVKQDKKRAAEWFEKWAEQGSVETKYSLAYWYWDGEAVAKNRARANDWYAKAAELGHPPAMVALAISYFVGEGVPKSEQKAAELSHAAAVLGEPEGQYRIGLMYQEGRGVIKNAVFAYAWLNIAAARGKDEMRAARDAIARRLGPAERAEAERLALSWQVGSVLEGEEAVFQSLDKPSLVTELAKVGTGTAFFVSKRGHAVTSLHNVAACKEIRFSDKPWTISLTAKDESNDLALLHADGQATSSAVLASKKQPVRQGQRVSVFGYPLNSVLSSSGNITPGVISAISGLGNNSSQFQITAPIQPGSSGSPILSNSGSVIGVVSAKLSDSVMARELGVLPQNVNFGVQGAVLQVFLDSEKVEWREEARAGRREKSLEAISEESRRWTVVVECWRDQVAPESAPDKAIRQ